MKTKIPQHLLHLRFYPQLKIPVLEMKFSQSFLQFNPSLNQHQMNPKQTLKQRLKPRRKNPNFSINLTKPSNPRLTLQRNCARRGKLRSLYVPLKLSFSSILTARGVAMAKLRLRMM